MCESCWPPLRRISERLVAASHARHMYVVVCEVLWDELEPAHLTCGGDLFLAASLSAALQDAPNSERPCWTT